MKNYLNFENDIKELETEIEKIVREIKLFTSIEPNYILENAEK